VRMHCLACLDQALVKIESLISFEGSLSPGPPSSTLNGDSASVYFEVTTGTSIGSVVDTCVESGTNMSAELAARVGGTAGCERCIYKSLPKTTKLEQVVLDNISERRTRERAAGACAI